MTRARRELVSLETTPYYHCICRCVRRAFLCGRDDFSGRSYEHRKSWALERLRMLESIFAVDICAYAIMSNHYHLVVRLDRAQNQGWSDAEVVARWSRLFSLPVLVTRYRCDETDSEAERIQAQAIIARWRERLCDLSWFMRSLNEYLARRANEEDGCKGRFWEGRFKSQALLDEAAVLTCMSYVDLNPVRAGLAKTPEESEFTSVRQRIEAYIPGGHMPEASEPAIRGPRLMTLGGDADDAHPNRLTFSFVDYLALVEWCGCAIRDDKRGATSQDIPPILERLRLDPAHFLRHMRRGGQHYHVAAIGHVARLRAAAISLGRKYLKGLSLSRHLYETAA